MTEGKKDSAHRESLATVFTNRHHGGERERMMHASRQQNEETDAMVLNRQS